MLKIMDKLLRSGRKRTAAILGAALMVMGSSSALAAPVGSPIDFSGVNLPFNVPDMLTTAVNFLAMYGQWILLALGVIFAPVLYGLAIRLISAVRRRTQTN